MSGRHPGKGGISRRRRAAKELSRLRTAQPARREAGRSSLDRCCAQPRDGKESPGATDVNCGNDSPRQKPITRQQHASARRKTHPNQHPRRRGAGQDGEPPPLRLDKRGPPLPSSPSHRPRAQARPMRRRRRKGLPTPLRQKERRAQAPPEIDRPKKLGSFSPATRARYLTSEAI